MIVYKLTTFQRLPEIEEWLNTMAQQGYLLVRVYKSNYEFCKSTSQKMKHKCYCFSYYWKGKKNAHSVYRHVNYSNIRNVAPSMLSTEFFSDVVVDLLELTSKKSEEIQAFKDHYQKEYALAIKHLYFSRIAFIFLVLCLIFCLIRLLF